MPACPNRIFCQFTGEAVASRHAGCVSDETPFAAFPKTVRRQNNLTVGEIAEIVSNDATQNLTNNTIRHSAARNNSNLRPFPLKPQPQSAVVRSRCVRFPAVRYETCPKAFPFQPALLQDVVRFHPVTASRAAHSSRDNRGQPVSAALCTFQDPCSSPSGSAPKRKPSQQDK